jgi:ketosteroid isomerase-like protein
MEAAIVANDAPAFAALVTDEFLLIGQRYNGKPATKAERIATLEKQKATGARGTTPARMRSMDVRLFGDTALMTTEQAAADSGALSRGTRVWVRRDGRWQLVISQQTPVEP